MSCGDDNEASELENLNTLLQSADKPSLQIIATQADFSSSSAIEGVNNDRDNDDDDDESSKLRVSESSPRSAVPLTPRRRSSSTTAPPSDTFADINLNSNEEGAKKETGVISLNLPTDDVTTKP